MRSLLEKDYLARCQAYLGLATIPNYSIFQIPFLFSIFQTSSPLVFYVCPFLFNPSLGLLRPDFTSYFNHDRLLNQYKSIKERSEHINQDLERCPPIVSFGAIGWWPEHCSRLHAQLGTVPTTPLFKMFPFLKTNLLSATTPGRYSRWSLITWFHLSDGWSSKLIL